LWDRKVIGWALSHTMTAKDTSIAALKMALQNRPLKDKENLLFRFWAWRRWGLKSTKVQI
jgi:hypothetical protein